SLVQKEWVSHGHHFLDRLHHLQQLDSEEAPIFQLFLDCVWQLGCASPCALQFADTLLCVLSDTVHLPLFSTFLFNGDFHRHTDHLDVSAERYIRSDGARDSCIPHAWNWELQFHPDTIRSHFYNPLYRRHTRYLRPPPPPCATTTTTTTTTVPVVPAVPGGRADAVRAAVALRREVDALTGRWRRLRMGCPSTCPYPPLGILGRQGGGSVGGGGGGAGGRGGGGAMTSLQRPLFGRSASAEPAVTCVSPFRLRSLSRRDVCVEALADGTVYVTSCWGAGGGRGPSPPSRPSPALPTASPSARWACAGRHFLRLMMTTPSPALHLSLDPRPTRRAS
ncbi:unnamed protein product, partial [Lampetra fluviatilis]